MRDTFHIFPDITVTGTSATCVPADSADFLPFGAITATGYISVNAGKFSGHHTGQADSGLRMVYQPQANVASGNIFTLVIQDSADNSGFAAALSGAVTTLGAILAAGTLLYMPMPFVHRRYLRPAVVTGATYAGSATWKTWLEFGGKVV